MAGAVDLTRAAPSETCTTATPATRTSEQREAQISKTCTLIADHFSGGPLTNFSQGATAREPPGNPQGHSDKTKFGF